ncbi:hypothetical protein F2P79_025347 [Pimephales promelas]|nr:hypothetical protein F2P79_025347 [Pimephales promelas]
MLTLSHLFSAVISGRLSRKKWRSSTSVCRSCCTARGSKRHQAEVLKKFYRSLVETEDAIISGFIHFSTDTTPWITQRKTRARTRARTSPPPLLVLEISTRNRFSPLCESERDAAVVIGTPMVRHVRATSGKDKVRTHCFPGAHVIDVAAQVPEILNGDERGGTVVLNVGANDIRLRF